MEIRHSTIKSHHDAGPVAYRYLEERITPMRKAIKEEIWIPEEQALRYEWQRGATQDHECHEVDAKLNHG